MKNAILRAHLDERFCALEEMLSTIWLGSLLVPVYNSLVGDTVLVIQNLQITHQHCEMDQIAHPPP